MRIFIGWSEIGNFVATYAWAAQSLRHQTFTVIGRRNPFFTEFPYDLVISDKIAEWGGTGLHRKIARSAVSRAYSMTAFLKALATCDLFIYNTGGSILPGYADYRLIKRMGKKLVVTFLGSEIRYWYAFEQEMKQLGYWDMVSPYVQYFKDHPYGTYFEKLSRVRAAEQYADLILAQPGFAQLLTKPYKRVWIGLDLSKYRFCVPRRAVPLVLHAPSNRDVKGTAYVLSAVEQLRQENIPFEFRLIENLPNAQLRELLSEADILVDELYADTIGVLSTEAMATGNAVLTSYLGPFNKVPSSCPAVDVTAATLTDRLRQVIVDSAFRGRLADAGRVYVETYHDATRVFQQILNWLEPSGIQQYDFVPTFYRSFAPPPELMEKEREQARGERKRRWRKWLAA